MNLYITILAKRFIQFLFWGALVGFVNYDAEYVIIVCILIFIYLFYRNVNWGIWESYRYRIYRPFRESYKLSYLLMIVMGIVRMCIFWIEDYEFLFKDYQERITNNYRFVRDTFYPQLWWFYIKQIFYSNLILSQTSNFKETSTNFINKNFNYFLEINENLILKKNNKNIVDASIFKLLNGLKNINKNINLIYKY